MDDSNRRTVQFWKELAQWKRLETETSWWLLANVLDFVMTFIMLMHPRNNYRESNPIAAFFYNHWGLKGLVAFKVFMAVFVAVICQIIALKKRDTARAVLVFGTAVVGLVFVYSACLYVKGGRGL